jgi:hypothetical protein
MYADMLDRITAEKADIIISSYFYLQRQGEYVEELPWKVGAIFKDHEILKKSSRPLFLPMDISGASSPWLEGYVWRCLFSPDVIDLNRLRFNTEIRYVEDMAFVVEFLSIARRAVIVNVPYYHYSKIQLE